MHRLHLLIRGRVQGVGFRYFVVQRARSLALSGWVRNRADGTVEVRAEGERPALEALHQAVKQGPPAARIAEVVEDWSEETPQFRDFVAMD